MCALDAMRRWVRAHTYPRPQLRHMGATPVPAPDEAWREETLRRLLKDGS